MTEETRPTESGRPLIVDELDETFTAFLALRKSDEDGANAMLSDVGADSVVDRQIMLELAAPRPLGHPERFPQAHALLMRAMEVLDRNGSRGIKYRGLGPLRPLAEFTVQLVTQFLVRSHLARVITDVRRLYTRREANTMAGDPVRRMLTRARYHTERVAEGYKKNPLGLPTFLLGGAVISGLFQVAREAGVLAFSSFVNQVVSLAILFVVFGASSFVILQGAAIARRRIHLTLDRPLAALYETVGRCGEPPKDQARVFAVLAMVGVAVVSFSVPIALIVAWLLR